MATTQSQYLTRLVRLDGLSTRVEWYPSLESTNTTLWSLVERREYRGLPGGIIDYAVVAEQQTKGYGRYGRRWHSPVGVNIYTSLHLTLNPDDAVANWLIVAAVSTRSVLSRLLTQGEHTPIPQMKWPNDVVVGERKIAGFIMETRQLEPRRLDVVLGVGVNVNMKFNDVGGEITEPWTSLRAVSGMDFDRIGVWRDLMRTWQHSFNRYQTHGLSEFIDRWRREDRLKGCRIQVDNPHSATPPMTGMYLGLDDNGRLLLDTEAGERRLEVGTVTVLTPSE